MATLGQYYIQVNPSAEGISGKLKGIMDPAASVAGESAGKSLGSQIASAATKAIAAIGVGKLLKESILAGADLEQSIGGIETLFGAGGAKSVQEYADAANKSIGEVKDEYARLVESENLAMDNAAKAWQTSGLSANDYMQTVTGFAAALKQSTDSELEAVKAADMAVIDMSDNANKMGTDMSSIQMAYAGFAKQNYTMLDNLKLGYGGTKGEMERLLADATALSGIDYNIENLSDVYEAIHVIQDDLGITGTTAKEAASTFSGSMNAMKAAAQNLMANLALGNDISDELNNLTESFLTWAGNLIPMVGNILKGLPAVIDSLLENIAGSFAKINLNSGEFLQMGARIITDIAKAIVDWAPFLLGQFASAIGSLAQAIATVDWIGMAHEIIDTLGASIDEFAQEWFGTDAGGILPAIMNGITQNLPSLLSQGVEIITGIANGILSALPQMITTAGELISQFAGFILQNLPVIAQKGGELIRGLISGIAKNLPQIAVSAFQAITRFRVTLLQHLPDLLSAGLSLCAQIGAGIIQAIPQIIASIPQIVSGIADTIMSHNWLEIGWNIITGIVEGLISYSATILEAIAQVCQPILDGLNLTEPIAAIWESIKGAISEKWEAIKAAVFGAVESVRSTVQTKFEAARTAISTAVENAKTAVTTAFTNIVTTVFTKVENVRSTIQTKFNEAKILIKNAVEEAWRQVQEKFQKMVSTVTEKATAIYNTARDKFNEMKNKVTEILGNLLTNIKTKVQEMWQAISDKFKEIVETAKEKFNEVKEAVLGKIGELVSALPGKLAEVASEFSTAFSDLASKALDWGKDIIQGIVDGINAKLEAVRTAAGNVASAVRNILGFSEPEEGPLSDFHTYMPDMIALMVKGINDGIPKIRAAAEGLALEIRPELDTSYMRQGRAMQMPTAQTGGYTQNLTINSPRELSPSETARLQRIATQNTILKMRMA